MIRIPSTLYNIIVSIFTILLTTAVLSFILIFSNNELKEFPFDTWLKTWRFVFIIAYLLSLFLPKLIKKLVSLVFRVENYCK